MGPPASTAAGPSPPASPVTQPTTRSSAGGGGGCYHVCIHCGRRAAQGLYREYSRDNIRLMRCAACGAVADPLVEHELLLVMLDLALHKREAYRHLLFNRPPHCALGWRGLLRVAAVLLVLDTHSRYAVYAHAAAAAATAAHSSHGTLAAAAAAAGAAGGFVDQDDTPAVQLRLLLRLLLLTLLEHAAFAGIVVGGALWLFGRRRRRRRKEDGHGSTGGKGGGAAQGGLGNKNDDGGGGGGGSHDVTARAAAQPPDPYPAGALTRALLQALLYPAFGRLLVPFIMVWDPAVAVAGVVGALVLSSQWQALHAVATSAPFAPRAGASAPEGAGGAAAGGAAADDDAKAPAPASASSSYSSIETVVALPFLLGLVGRAALRLLLAGRVVALEGGGGSVLWMGGAAAGGAD